MAKVRDREGVEGWRIKRSEESPGRRKDSERRQQCRKDHRAGKDFEAHWVKIRGSKY